MRKSSFSSLTSICYFLMIAILSREKFFPQYQCSFNLHFSNCSVRKHIHIFIGHCIFIITNWYNVDIHNDHINQREFVPVYDISWFLLLSHSPLPVLTPLPLMYESFTSILSFFYHFFLFHSFPPLSLLPFPFKQFFPISQYILYTLVFVHTRQYNTCNSVLFIHVRVWSPGPSI